MGALAQRLFSPVRGRSLPPPTLAQIPIAFPLGIQLISTIPLDPGAFLFQSSFPGPPSPGLTADREPVCIASLRGQGQAQRGRDGLVRTAQPRPPDPETPSERRGICLTLAEPRPPPGPPCPVRMWSCGRLAFIRQGSGSAWRTSHWPCNVAETQGRWLPSQLCCLLAV